MDPSFSDIGLTALTRVRRGLRQRRHWLAFLRFGTVGASGYLVNLATFAFASQLMGAGHRVAALAAFLVAVSNNFMWNRMWTFPAVDAAAHRQALRFLTVSVLAFGVSLGILEILVSLAGVTELPAQALAVITVMPLNFVFNKLWTFSAPPMDRTTTVPCDPGVDTSVASR